MKIKFFSNYSDSCSLMERCLRNYPIPDHSGLEVTSSDEYDVAVVFNYTLREIGSPKAVITIVQEPAWYFDGLENPFLTHADCVILHDHSAFPYATNVQEHPSIMFYHDREPYSFFKTVAPTKSRTISMIVSGKNFCKGHQDRLGFLNKILQSDLDIDIYGRGLRLDDWRYKGELDSKHVGLLPYRYSICIENAIEKNYLTEKFIDSMLCDTVPIYYGASNSGEIYDPGGFAKIDIHSKTVIEDIKKIITGDYLNARKYNSLNKAKYFQDYNIFKILEDILL